MWGFISGFSKSTVDLSPLSLVSYSVDNYHFVVNFEISKCEYSDFFFSILFAAILDPLQFHMNFRISLFISRKKKTAGILHLEFNMSTILGLY